MSELAATYLEAMRIWEAQKAQGVSLEERQLALKKSLCAAWPETTDFRALCPTCDDYGWIFRVCRDQSCGRPFRLPKSAGDDYTGKGHCTGEHVYCAPCHVCEKGQGYRRNMQKEPPALEDFTAAGKQKPMSRFGR